MNQLLQLWQHQEQYNDHVKAVQPERTDWMETYLLGLTKQVGDVLEAMQWERHRKEQGVSDKTRRENIAHDLADATKYLFSLWQEQGFSAQDMLDRTLDRTWQLELRFQSDWFPVRNSKVIVTDLDGTGADYRKGWTEWSGIPDAPASLALDLDNGIRYGDYDRLKREFEESGGYANLAVYPDWRHLLLQEKEFDTQILVTTARPAKEMKSVETDTYAWLRQYNIPHTGDVVFGRDERILELIHLGARDNKVVLLEDEPTLALRAAKAGYPVLLRIQPYNKGVEHPLIWRVQEFPKQIPWGALYPDNEDRYPVTEQRVGVARNFVKAMTFGERYGRQGTMTGRIPAGQLNLPPVAPLPEESEDV